MLAFKKISMLLAIAFSTFCMSQSVFASWSITFPLRDDATEIMCTHYKSKGEVDNCQAAELRFEQFWPKQEPQSYKFKTSFLLAMARTLCSIPESIDDKKICYDQIHVLFNMQTARLTYQLEVAKAQNKRGDSKRIENLEQEKEYSQRIATACKRFEKIH